MINSPFDGFPLESMYDDLSTYSSGALEKRSLLGDITESVRESLLILGEDLRVQWANPSFYRHFCVEPDETVGRLVYDLGAGQWNIPGLRVLLKKVLQEKRHFEDVELQHTFEELGRRTMLLTVRRIDDLPLILLAIEDATERGKAEEALRRSEERFRFLLREAQKTAQAASRAKGDFLANVSHEIRTPMTVIMASLELLQQATSAAERKRLQEMAQDAGERLLHLIDDILDFSRIDTRRMEIVREPFSLRSCVERAVELFQGPAREKGIRMGSRIDAQVPPLILGDPFRLEQVLTHLLGNAVKFTERGSIEIEVDIQGENIRIQIRDSGIGIPPEDMDRLFRRFSQVDSSLTRRYGGVGLGLAISKGLVEMMGGEILAESRKGRGSGFTVLLPLEVADVEATGSGPKPRTAEPATPAPRILLAEDDPAARKLITMLLERSGWEPEVAASGQEALAKWREREFEVILMDVQMPEMDGLEATSRIREMEREKGSHTCIIALTAHSRPEDRQKCLAAGMDTFLPKPMHRDELVLAIKGCAHHG